jgi:serine/threonine-protein kinase
LKKECWIHSGVLRRSVSGEVMDDKNQNPEQMPQTIGRYQIAGSIGYGAMGAVYKAFDPLIKRTLAIKTIRLDIPRQSPQYKSFIERFYHEARISGTLSHPNIVTLFDIGEEGGIPYLAMEYVEGETIASLIEKGVRFNPEKVISLVSQIASAIDYAHSKGVIHRDIKPSNLILFESERVKVTDFGIAKLVDAEMTQSGTLLGTPSYMSPEQAMGDKLDGRSDIFSLGVCAFEMLSGEQPFPGNNVTSILYKLVHVDPIEPANLEMNGLVPQKWHDVFGKVLAKKPDDRYQTATEFVQDLEYCLGSWFGAAMGDETISEAVRTEIAAVTTASIPGKAAAAPPAPAKPAAPAKPEATAVRLAPAPKPVEQEVTASIPAVAVPAPAPVAAKPLAVAPPAKPPAKDKEEDELPPTVHMKAPATDPVGKTVVMRADQIPVAPPVKPAAKSAPKPVPKSAETGSVGATVVMSVPNTGQSDADATIRTPVMATTKMEAPAVTVKEPVGDATIRPTPSAFKAPPPKSATVPVAKAASPPPAAPQPGAAPPVPPLPPETAAAPVMPTSRGPRPGIPAVLILGGAALIFIIAIGVALLILIRHRRSADATPAPAPTPTPVALAPSTPPPPPPPSVAVATLGVLHVESTPAGATVTVNGEAKGTTPLDVADLPPADYEVKVELKGYQPVTQSVTLTAEQPKQELKAALKAAAPAMGVADILSTPFGAAVSIDGANVGLTPVTDFRLRVGNHQVEIAKEGYESFAAPVKVEAGKRARIDAQLRAIVKATPTPVPADVVDTSRIYLNTSGEVDTLAKKTSGPSASYPENAPKLRSGESVSASVSFVVNENGEVGDIKVVESGGKMVDEAVMSAIRNWKYSPAAKKGTKVKVRITFKQTFKAG